MNSSRTFPSSPQRLSGFYSLCSLAGLFVVVLSVAGCGGGEKPPATVSVSGVVTYKGATLTKGTVMFQPEKKETKELSRPAMAQIGADGRYELSTFATGDGVIPGKYAVVVTSYLTDPTAEEYDQGVKQESAIPVKYTNALTSGLSKDVPAESAGGGITFDIELVD